VDTVILEDDEPFDLLLQLPIEVTATGENVTLTFPVFAAALPQSIGRIRLPLSLEAGSALAAQIQAAVRMAERRARDL
jgi:hypothetical protein